MKEKIKKLIIKALEELNIETDLDILVEVPKEKDKGDYATNIALQLTKKLGLSPKEIALKIVSSITDEEIDKIEIAGPGFINFFVKKDYLLNNIITVIKEDENYGRSTIGDNKRINLEYVSANPTGILHLGHARGAASGDSLANVLLFAGFDVTREYYINDAGNQMNNLGKSIKARYLNICGEELNMPEDGYHGKEIITIAEQLYNEYKDSKKEEKIEFFKRYGLDILLNQIKEDLKRFNVSFDVWTSEESIYKSGAVSEALDKLINKGYTYESENALFLKTTMYGDEKDRVLVKNDGNYTYLLPDIAYHIDKFNRNFDELIDILGADHHGYIARLKASMKMLDYDGEKIDVQILQMVRLLKDGEELKMSKRTGKSVTISELLDEVGPDAVRYFFVSRSLDSQMDFDMDLAIKKSNENPVYYINYAHARICSLLKDKEQYNYKNITKFETNFNESAYNVLKKIYEFKEVVERSALKREAHIITNYVYELAGLFHNYYATEKIITDHELFTKERLAFLKAVAITIRNALKLIGINAYEQM